jgi:hypothetical protein
MKTSKPNFITMLEQALDDSMNDMVTAMTEMDSDELDQLADASEDEIDLLGSNETDMYSDDLSDFDMSSTEDDAELMSQDELVDSLEGDATVTDDEDEFQFESDDEDETDEDEFKFESDDESETDIPEKEEEKMESRKRTTKGRTN